MANTTSVNEVSILIPHRESLIWRRDPHTGQESWELRLAPSTLRLLQEYVAQYGSVLNWPLPKGRSLPDLFLKRLILEARGEWKLPFLEAEICHCRAVPTETVVQAILSGAHRSDLVSRWTQASTACGTCRSDVVLLLDYILG